MPRAMIAYESMEVVVTPETTYILIDHIHDHRRIFTDGRTFPANADDIEPSYRGFSIGKWIDEGNTGTYNVLEVETRGFKGQRSYDTSGLPLHADNKTVVKERIYLDKNDSTILYDEITTIDNALSGPWKVTRKYQRDPKDVHPWWREVVCAENNQHVHIGNENYMISADGLLMPAKKDQPPPDLKIFSAVAEIAVARCVSPSLPVGFDAAAFAADDRLDGPSLRSGEGWCRLRGSNTRHPRYEGGALPC